MKRWWGVVLLVGCVAGAPDTPDAAPDTPDAAPDTPDADGRATATSRCPVTDLVTAYPGILPPNPYEPMPAADPCLLGAHDVIMVLGCPSNSDGSPSACQIARADLAVALKAAGIAREFIVSGAAVHNAYIEARALQALLVARGVPAGDIVLEEQAQHTDENIYYSSLIMQARGWQNAVVVSDDPGHLIMTAVCDADCCVDLGRLTVAGYPLTVAGRAVTQPLGHYVLYPDTGPVSADECTHIEIVTKAMCVNMSSRRACKGRLTL